MQGDVRFAEVMKLMGATVEYEPNAIVITGPGGKLKGFDHNCNDIPDAAMTAAVAAIFADGCASLCCAAVLAPWPPTTCVDCPMVWAQQPALPASPLAKARSVIARAWHA